MTSEKPTRARARDALWGQLSQDLSHAWSRFVSTCSGRSLAGKLPPKEWTGTYYPSTLHSLHKRGRQQSARTVKVSNHGVQRATICAPPFRGPALGRAMPLHRLKKSLTLSATRCRQGRRKLPPRAWCTPRPPRPTLRLSTLCTREGRRNERHLFDSEAQAYQESSATRACLPDDGRRIKTPTAPPGIQPKKLPQQLLYHATAAPPPLP